MPDRSHPLAPARLLSLWPWVAALLGGGLLALAYPPFDQAWLAWVGLAPLQAALWLRPRKRHAALIDLGLGYTTGALFFLITFSWLQTVTAIGAVLLALYLAIYPALWAWAIGPLPQGVGHWFRHRWLGKKGLTDQVGFPTPPALLPLLASRVNLTIAFLAASTWTATEWLRDNVLGGFGWNTLAVASHDLLGIIQIAEIGGSAAISWVMAFCTTIFTLTLVRFVIEVGRTKIRPHFDFTLTMALVGVCFVHGVRSLQREAGETTPLRVAMIQPNIPQSMKWDPDYADAILEKLVTMTHLAQTWEPDLTLWPEAATPDPFFNHRVTYQTVRDLGREMTGGLLFGTLELTIDADEEGQDYNVAVFFESSQHGLFVYRKLHLVPFGEYVPFRRQIPLLDRLVGGRVPGDFRSGSEPVLFTFEERPLRMAPLICFEDTLPRVARRFLAREPSANLFVNITNDAWFEESAGSRQHLANARLRTVEFRRPLIRCANTGVTCIIDQAGRIRQLLADEAGSTFMEGMLLGTVDVPLAPPDTLYLRVGPWVAWASLAFSLLWLLLSRLPLFRPPPEEPPATPSTGQLPDENAGPTNPRGTPPA